MNRRLLGWWELFFFFLSCLLGRVTRQYVVTLLGYDVRAPLAAAYHAPSLDSLLYASVIS